LKKTVVTILMIVLGNYCFGQAKKEKEIIIEGTKLYKTEMASWYGTDIFLEKFADKRQIAGGYFSYMLDENTVCAFFSNESSPKILVTFTFDSTFNVSTAVVDGKEREPSKQEYDLITIRQIALAQLSADTLFKSYNDMSPNLIPLNDENGKRVYILTGPKKQGIVVFGNDYLLTFDRDNQLKDKRQLHRNIIPIEYGKNDGKTIIATIHSHLPETGDLITATDICTLMLYAKYARWGQHYVMSEKNVSIWDCKKNKLVVLTRKAWDKIYASQEK
jgi:GTPase SAR1 family protein